MKIFPSLPRVLLALGAGVSASWDASADGSLDVRGWTDTRAPCFTVRVSPSGALVAAGSGTVLIDVSNPTQPAEIAFVPGPDATRRDAIWRDGYVYAVSDAGGGLQIIDWSDPGAPWVVDEVTTWFETARGLAYDPVLSRLLVCGTPEGLHALSIADPTAPTPAWAGPLSTFEVLDIVPLGALAHLATGTSMALMNLASTPDLLAWITYPGVTPRALAGDAGDGGPAASILTVADETQVSVLDTRTLSNIRRVATIVPSDGGAATPIAIALRNERVAIAWSTSEIEIVDASDVTHPASTASARVGTGLRDVAFSATEGILVACDATMGLVTLSLEDRWAEISGTVRDGNLGSPSVGARVHDVASGRSTSTSASGAFRLRVPSGSRTLEIDTFGFERASLVVETGPGSITIVDRALTPTPTGEMRGIITLPGPQPHPEGTIVRLLDTPVAFPAQLSGDYILPWVPIGNYIAEVDAMGSATHQVPITVSAGTTTRLDFFLSSSVYTDTFETESGWIVGDAEDDATSGGWTRAIPAGTAAGYVQPLADETPAAGTHAFVTGNGAPDDWFDEADVDGGRTTLTSPVIDLLGVEHPIFRYYRWLSLDARWEGETPDGDRFEAWISNDGGSSWTLVEERTVSDHRWAQIDYRLADHADMTDTMRFRFVISDRHTPSIVEAAIDDVEIFSGSGLERPPDYTPVQSASGDASLPPAPLVALVVRVTSAALDLRYRLVANVRSLHVGLYDVTGRRLRAVSGPTGSGTTHVRWSLDGSGLLSVPSGRYFVELNADGYRIAESVVVIR